MKAMPPTDEAAVADFTARIRSVVIGFSVALGSVVIAFGITIAVVVSTGSTERNRICDAVKGGFHEQADLFGEFVGDDDPRLLEYDIELQARLDRECG